MATFLNILKAILLSVAILFGFYATLAVRSFITLEKHAAQTLMAADDTIESVNKTVRNVDAIVSDVGVTLYQVNAPKTGTIAILNANLKAIRIATDNVNGAALKERFFLENTQPDEIAKVNKVLDSTTGLLNSTAKTVTDLQDTVHGATSEMQTLQTATIHLDQLVTDPHIKDTIVQTDGTMTNVNGATKDVRKAVHDYVYPGPVQRVWNFLTGTALDIGKFFMP